MIFYLDDAGLAAPADSGGGVGGDRHFIGALSSLDVEASEVYLTPSHIHICIYIYKYVYISEKIDKDIDTDIDMDRDR